MAKANLTKEANINATVREIDFVSRFAKNMEALKEVLGISRFIEKPAGANVKTRRGYVELADGNVGEGEEIPYSLARVEEIPVGEINLEKYAKGTSIEAINTYGYDVAVQKTDDALLHQLEMRVLNKMYAGLNKGEMTHIASAWQMAVAMANGLAKQEFKRWVLKHPRSSVSQTSSTSIPILVRQTSQYRHSLVLTMSRTLWVIVLSSSVLTSRSQRAE